MPMKPFHAVVLLTVLLLGSSMLAAQSGRKLPKGSPSVPTPTPTPELVVAAKPPPKPDFIVKVYSDIDYAGTFGLGMPDRMHDWAVQRLRRTPLLDVRNSGKVNRRDAIKQAKAETEAYVVLFELSGDPFGPYNRSSVNSVRIILTVYHPVTAKVKFTRTLTLRQNSTRLPGSTGVLQACNMGVYGDDLLLLEASLEAADSVLSTFNIARPPICSGTGL